MAVVTVGFDRPDDDAPAPTPDTPDDVAGPGDRDDPSARRPADSAETREETSEAGELKAVAEPEVTDADTARQARIDRALGYRTRVAAVERTYAIDQAYDKIRDTERTTVTPAMHRIESEDPTRHLAGLDNRLKGKDRLAEKVTEIVDERGHAIDAAVGLIKDAIRYTFVYSEDRYTEGVNADCDRLSVSFEPVDRKNSWDGLEYKGINGRWRVPDTAQLFEVQFHTQASLDAKEETHGAYERLRTLPEDDAEVSQLHAYQRAVTAKIPIPPGALDIPDYP